MSQTARTPASTGRGGQVDAVVVGAGLAGLTCALDLTAQGLTVRVLEAADAVGGRVRTDHVDGFTLDHGFQVLNTAYPALGGLVDLDALDLRAFDSAATVLLDGRHLVVGNPLKDLRSAPGLLRMPVGGIRGKAALAAYVGLCLTLPAATVRGRDDISSADAWRRAGIPTDVVNGLLRPFFSGVVLEQDMSTSRRFTDLMLKMFARGASTVPAGGMQRLPEQLAARLPAGTLRLGSRVDRVRERGVESSTGPVRGRAVVVATDGWTAAGLLPGAVRAPRPRGATTVYHAAAPFHEASGRLLLDGDSSPVANSIAISVAAPEYAPPDRVLVSTSMVHGSMPADVDGPVVRAALSRLHGTDTSSWELVATYDLPRALPAMASPHPMRRAVRITLDGRRVEADRASPGDTVYVAGDHRDTSSIQGAIVSGHRAADAVLADIGALV